MVTTAHSILPVTYPGSSLFACSYIIILNPHACASGKVIGDVPLSVVSHLLVCLSDCLWAQNMAYIDLASMTNNYMSKVWEP